MTPILDCFNDSGKQSMTNALAFLEFFNLRKCAKNIESVRKQKSVINH